jgi:hypothetical protein
MQQRGPLDRHPRQLQPQAQPGRRGALALGGLALWLAVAAVQAQAPAPSTAIYSCVDDRGRRITSDRPIASCTAKEQQILNRDGSVRGVHPPMLTPQERAEQEARERKASAERMALIEATRRDKNLLLRYPNEAAHGRAREAALDTVRLAIKATELRLQELAAERRPLLSEVEFYKDKRLPPKLKGQIEANDAAVDAQKSAALNQEAELDRVNRIYDTELARLRLLWAGAAPGSLGPLTAPTKTASDATPTPTR